VLGILGVKVDSAVEAAALLLSPDPQGLSVLTTREVVVGADSAELEVGIDGEAMILPTPVHCRVEPGVLRVRVPKKRPGVPTVQPALDWRRLFAMAMLVGRTAGVHRRGHGPRPRQGPERGSDTP
jgi:hypothetical protein